METIRRNLSDESAYEPHYAYGKEIYEDFVFNVGRKIQILKSSIKVWSCLTGSKEYHEKKLMEMVHHIKLMESLQNFLPVVPSALLLEMFKQTTHHKINTLDLADVFYHVDVFLGMIFSYFSPE